MFVNKPWKKNAIVKWLKSPENLSPFVCTVLMPADAMNRHEYAH